MNKKGSSISTNHPTSLFDYRHLKVWPIIVLPALLAIGFILHFSVDVPFWDEWHTPGHIYESIIEGSVNFQDFFSQHNESRMTFPKLIFVAVGFTLGWHVTIFMVLSWFCVLLSFLIVVKLLQSTTEEHPFMFVFIAFLLGALLFSTSQWENQLMGMQLAIFIPPFCLALSLLLQSTLKSYGLKAVSIALLSMISTFSYANGMVVWLLAFPFVRTLLTEEWKTSPYREKIKIVSWTTVYIVLAVATIKFYFWDYRSNGIHQFFNVVLQDPGLGFNYFTAWLGSPLRYARDTRSAIIVGMGIEFLVVLSLVVIAIKWKNSSDNAVLKSCYPWICFILYGILSGLAITAGRARYGLDYALSSRHTTHSLWVIIGLVGVFYTLWDYQKNRQRIATNVAFGILMGVISLLIVWSWFGGYRSMQTASLRSKQNLLTLRLLDAVPSNPLLNRLWAYSPNMNWDIGHNRANMLINEGILNVDQIGDWLKQKVQAPDGQDAGWFTISSNGNENKINVSGWAMLPGKGVPADFVVLAKKDQSGDIEIVTGFTNRIKRPDVAEAKHNPKLLLSGFEDSLEDTHVDSSQFVMFAVDLDDQRVYELRQKNVTYSFSNNVVNAYIKTPRQEYVPRSEVKFTINNDSRMVMFQHPNSEVLFKNVSIKEESKLEFGIGINEIAWGKSGDGVLFEIIMIDENSHRNLIFSKWIDPKNNPEDRKWFDYSLDLQPFHGQKVTFIFKTTDGPRGDNRYDWAGWSRPMITSIVDKNEG